MVIMQVPFLSLRAQHGPVMTAEMLEAFRQVKESLRS
jgi:hypothetical protein